MSQSKTRHRRRIGAVAIAAIVLSTPARTVADAPPPAASASSKVADSSASTPVRAAVNDVALGPQGELVGRVVKQRGEPWADVQVEVVRDNVTIATPITDGNGEFRIRRLRGGLYQLRAENSVTAIRAWAPGTAPPSAAAWATLVQDVQRGQGCPTPGCKIPGCAGRCGRGSALAFLLHPAVVATAVGAAIAIPLALDDDDNGASN